ncbi:MAG TPA: hypothetical protein VFN79_07760, partial [Steroidobacteraceae bacterium]|nr:hypothetical protein [Steroidobacteraceae bacterium]
MDAGDERFALSVGACEMPSNDLVRHRQKSWRRAAHGDRVREEHLTFVDFKQMLGTLSDERLRLLKEVRREEAASVRELAERLHRD